MRRLTILPFVLVVAVAVAGSVLAGCGGSPGRSLEGTAGPASESARDADVIAVDRGEVYRSPEAGEPAPGDWLIMRLGADPPVLNPVLDTSDAYAAVITAYIFESLLERDRETLELQPMLAESYEVSDDYLTYTFKMREDAHFSDGTPLTAHDLKFTFDAIMNPENETAKLRNYYQDVESVELLDDYTIRFQCSRPYFRHLIMLGGLGALPRHIYGEGNFNTHPSNRRPVGSGPYVFEAWDTNQQISLARNPNYWNADEPVHLDKLVWRIIANDNAAFQVLEQQQIDVMGLTPEQWVNRASRPGFKEKFTRYTYWATTGYLGNYRYIGWNMRRPLFEDRRVRRALTMLLDRETIAETIYEGLVRVTASSMLPGTLEHNDAIAPWPFDPDTANALLDEAGWNELNRDGIRTKEGQPFQFELMISSDIPEIEQMATVYKEELERAGIRMVIRSIEWSTLIDQVQRRHFDAVVLGWAIPVDQDPYQIWHSSQAEQGSNYPGFKNGEVDEILESARMEFDRDQRIALYHRFQEILHEEQPYTFLFNSQALVAVDKRFRGVNVYATGFDYREWWAPRELQRY